MKREKLEQYIMVLKEKNPLGMSPTIFDLILKEKNEFKADLQVAKLIDRLLPEKYEEALKIYIDVLNETNIEKAFKENKDDDIETIIEEIIWGYMNAAIIFKDKKSDLQNALKYIDEGKDFMNRYPIHMKYISKGEVYYTRWKILEQSREIGRVFEEINTLLK